MGQGPGWSFERFVVDRQAALLRTAIFLVGDRELGEDLLQDVLFRASRHWRRIEDPDAYLRRALVNAANSRWRRRRPREEPWEETSDRGMAGEAERIPVRDGLLTALRALSPRQRAVLILRYFADLSEGQTAAILGCSPGSVKTHAARGLHRMRAVLADDQPVVAVGWLPPGTRRVSLAAEIPQVHVEFEAAYEARQPARSFVGGARPTLVQPRYWITVSRGGATDLKPEAAGAARGGVVVWTTVHGEPAFRATTSDVGPDLQTVRWNENGVALTVSTSHGTLPALLNIADGLAVFPPPAGPRDSAAATRAVQDTTRQAFDGASPYAALAAVAGGEKLRAAMAEAVRVRPETISTMRVTKVDPVVFTSPTSVVVGIEMSRQLKESGNLVPDTSSGVIALTRTPAGWKVLRQSFCDDLLGTLTCPPA